VLSLGSALLVTVSLGSMGGEIGGSLIIVWASTAFIGLIQCLFLAELASGYPQTTGGAPAYNHEGFKNFSPLFGAVSSWGYWVGWIPGVAANLIVASNYIKAAFLPSLNILETTLVLAVFLHILNYFGLRLSVWVSATMGVCAIAPLAVILMSPVFRHSLWNSGNFFPLMPKGLVWYSRAGVLLFAKWMFVAVWSSYGGEMVATLGSEITKPEEAIPKVLGLAAATTLLAFVAVPVVLVAIVGPSRLAEDPYVVFLSAARGSLEPMGPWL
jgi:amino acid transporter